MVTMCGFQFFSNATTCVQMLVVQPSDVCIIVCLLLLGLVLCPPFGLEQFLHTYKVRHAIYTTDTASLGMMFPSLCMPNSHVFQFGDCTRFVSVKRSMSGNHRFLLWMLSPHTLLSVASILVHYNLVPYMIDYLYFGPAVNSNQVEGLVVVCSCCNCFCVRL